MTNKQKTALVAAIDKKRTKARELFKSAGKDLDELVASCDVDEEITLPDGRTFRIVDNFDGKNTAFKPTAFTLYDIQECDAEVW